MESRHYLLGRDALRKGISKKYYEFARFTVEEEGESSSINDEFIPECGAHDVLRNHPLDTRCIVEGIPSQVKGKSLLF